MLRLVTGLIATLVALAPVNAMPQSKDQDPKSRNSDLVTRIAYRSTYWSEGQQLHQACFALYRNGYYLLERTTQNGPRKSQSLQGYLGQKEMIPVTGMLKNLDFGKSRGSTVLQDSEVFVADVVNDNKIVRHVWLDPDGQRPLPDSAVRIVNWLQSFKPQDASVSSPSELSFQPVCPVGRWEQLPDRANPAANARIP